MRKFILSLTLLLLSAGAVAAGMMGVGRLMSSTNGNGSASGSAILTESSDLLTTESGEALRIE